MTSDVMQKLCRLAAAAAAIFCISAPATARESHLDVDEPGRKPRWRLGLEGKFHYRDSELTRIRSPFQFEPIDLPVGQDAAFLETVNEGSHVEISNLSLLFDASWSEGLEAHAKIDFIRLYDRNPTSTDRQVEVDELWVRFGRESEVATVPERKGAYLKVGKFGKFERQDDRHLESYGLISTAFNRFEDIGVELGFELGPVYFKGSLTQGNPLFFRDPNALAGDNGTPASLRRPNPDPALNSGMPILYDAEVEGIDVDGDLELGLGLGFRIGGELARTRADFLVWSYDRELAETVELEGTLYGGDLDLLLGPFNMFPLDVSGNDKEEIGANLWLYSGGFSLFAQYVDQEVAGLDRTGFEVELAWAFELPLRFSVAGEQLFSYIQPAVRFSRQDPEFDGGSRNFPAPSVRWDWDKIDLGVRLGIIGGVDLTLEWADNEFVLLNGKGSLDELLLTVSFRR